MEFLFLLDFLLMKCVGVKLQVRLPRQQLYVCRVSPKTSIQQILDQVCQDKGFDSRRYELRKTGKKYHQYDMIEFFTAIWKIFKFFLLGVPSSSFKGL